jgi:hypothetical protein
MVDGAGSLEDLVLAVGVHVSMERLWFPWL